MQVNEDIAHVIIEVLATKKRPLSFIDLLDEAPFDKKEVFGALNVLLKVGLFQRLSSSPGNDDATYGINKNLSAYQINKAVELGLDFVALTKWLGITEKQKQASLNLATQAKKLKELDEEQRALKIAELAKNQQLPRDMIVETLERLAEASLSSIEEFKTNKNLDESVIKALQDARQQTLKALSNYQNELARGRGASIEDL